MTRLVLTRKLDEEVVIHDNGNVLMSVKVSKVSKNNVRLAFESDSEIPLDVDRIEIYNSKHPAK
jgi:carbon storage regulator CsrA